MGQTLADNPTQPEDKASPQDQDLEAQLDDMLDRLEDADPQPVAPEPVEYKPTEPVSDSSDPVVAEDEAGVEDTPVPAEQAASPLDPDTISSMTNDLLSAQIDSTIEAAEAEARIEAFAADEPLHDPIQPDPTEVSGEDGLDEQIQGLLNDVQKQDATADEADTDAPQTEIVETPDAQAPDAAAEAVEPTEVVAEVPEEAAVAATEQALDDDAGAVSIDQIDAMLAESAAEAIEHGPEPEADIPPGTDEVLAAQAKAEQEAEARAKADRDAAEPMPIPTAVTSEPEPSEAQPTQPEPVATEPVPVASEGASAQDVANELDNDAQSPVKPVKDPAEAAFAEPAPGEATEPVVINRSGLKKAEYALLMICSKINKPLNRLSPELRDSVGYAGVVTTGLAFFMLIYGVLF